MKKKRNTLKILIIALFCFMAVLGGVVFVVFSPYVDLYGDYNTDISEVAHVSNTVKLFDKDGKIEFSPYNKGEYVKIETLPHYVSDAFVSIEDKRFYNHSGIDFIRIAGAFVDNIKSGKFKEGGSTITQQLVKNTILYGDKTIERKIKEIKLAQKVEKKYKKKEILEKYLNVVYFGSNVYGLANASRHYLGKDASELTVAESAMLAGVINNPTLYNPYKNQENALKRRNYILKLMKERNVITDEQYNFSIQEKLNLVCGKASSTQYYNQVMRILELNNVDFIRDKDVAVTLTIDRDLSETVSKVVEELCSDYNVNVIIAENASGNVLCNVSTFRYDISSARFMPGSVIKPILCYAPLLENNEIYTVSPVNDEHYSVGEYMPENFNKKYRGRISQSEALAYSSNSVALQNVEKIGLENAVRFAEKTGLHFTANDRKNYATALGGIERGFTLNEILASYLCIANNGNRTAPLYVNCIDKRNQSVFLNTNINEKAMKAETAFLLSEMMWECAEFGTAKLLKNHKNVCAKTGTVGDKDGNSDCYCIAFSPSYTVLCHVSENNKELPLEVMGGTLPTRIADRIFKILGDNAEIQIPNGIVKRDISLSEYENGNIVLAPLYECEKNKKSCWFSEENIPPYQNNSYDDFIEKYELSYSYDFDIFDSFVN